MRIASREKVAGRTHHAAGGDYTFNPEPGTELPMLCVVDDPAAQSVFLHERNANIFYAFDDVDVRLTRPTGAPAATPSLAILDASADDVIAAVGKLELLDLAALRQAEQNGKTRKTVIAAIDKRITALEKPQANTVVAEQAALIVDNQTEAVLAILDQIKDPAILAEIAKQETAGQARAEVLEKIARAQGK